MKKLKLNVRNFIYVNGMDYNNNCFYSSGIEFNEFMSCINNRPENLILLKHSFFNAHRNADSRFDFVTSQEINELINDNVYSYGDFCWVDFNTLEDLDRMSDLQIAEFLFFGHMAKPLYSIPNSRFAYYAHDDGWFNKLYVTQIEDYQVMLSRVITHKLRSITKRSYIEIPLDVSEHIIHLTREGLLIDFAKVQKSKIGVMLPITIVGHDTDMDNIIKLKDEISEYKIWLEYSRKAWKLIVEG